MGGLGEGVFSCGKAAFPFCYKETPVVVICQSVKHVLLVEGCGTRRVSSFLGVFMIGFLVRKIFGSKNDRFLKKLRPLVAKING